MIIGVISDSHDNIYALRNVLRSLVEKGVEEIIHLGDIISPFTVKLMYELLRDSKIPVTAIKGNNDGDIHLLTSLFNKYEWVFKTEPSVITIENRKLLILHGFDGADFTDGVSHALATSLDVDAVLYGHTHRPVLKQIDGKLILNPGEVCGYLTGMITYSTLDLSTMKAEIFEYK
ncbi:MAG: metallophosphoesterase [Desulfurococcaceae archaeon]